VTSVRKTHLRDESIKLHRESKKCTKLELYQIARFTIQPNKNSFFILFDRIQIVDASSDTFIAQCFGFIEVQLKQIGHFSSMLNK